MTDGKNKNWWSRSRGNLLEQCALADKNFWDQCKVEGGGNDAKSSLRTPKSVHKFPGGVVVKTPAFQCRMFNPWLES